MTGAEFKKVVPKYQSRPDLKKTEIHHQYLCHDKNKFHDLTILYGKKQNLRDTDPPMKEILGWGEYDPPVKSDFTSNKGAFFEKYKINKLGVEYISEKQDNFRDPAAKVNGSKVDMIIQYLKEENQRQIKQKIYNNLIDKEQMAHFSTEYRDQSKKQNLEKSETARKLHNHYGDVTVAGVPRYLKEENKKRQPIIAPGTLKDEFIEEKILQNAWMDYNINPQLIREEQQSLSERQLAQDTVQTN